MADLSFSQSADPVEVFDSITGNKLIPNSDGSLSTDLNKIGGAAVSLGQKAMTASVPIVIASDQSPIQTKLTDGVDLVAVNTDGSLNVNVIAAPSAPPSANTISQFVAQNKVYSFSADINMGDAASNNPLILLKNPVASGKVIYLYKVIFGINVTNVFAEFKIYANPTITTNGTAITPASCNIGGGAPASILQAFILSTVSSPGTNLESVTISQNNSAFGVLEDFSIFIQAGNNLLLTGNPGSNNREAAVTVVWAEV